MKKKFELMNKKEKIEELNKRIKQNLFMWCLYFICSIICYAAAIINFKFFAVAGIFSVYTIAFTIFLCTESIRMEIIRR